MEKPQENIWTRIARKRLNGEPLTEEEQKLADDADKKRTQEIERERLQREKPITKPMRDGAKGADERHRKMLGDDYE